MSHTPGPLLIEGPSPGGTAIDNGGDYAIMDEDGYIIGEAINLVGDGRFADAKANATLWAAAPKLLEACKAALRSFEEEGGPAGVINSLEAAIAKVKGEV